MINSVEEIDQGILYDGFDEMMSDPIAKAQWKTEHEQRQYFKNLENIADKGYGYWLDNCGDDEWYCQHCLQEDCQKRMAPMNTVVKSNNSLFIPSITTKPLSDHKE